MFHGLIKSRHRNKERSLARFAFDAGHCAAPVDAHVGAVAKQFQVLYCII